MFSRVKTEPASAENDNSTHITVKVKDQAKLKMHFRITRDIKFKRLMDKYCIRTGRVLGSCKFLYDGMHLKGDQTPAELKMEDGDKIDVFEDQGAGKSLFIMDVNVEGNHYLHSN